MENKDFVGMFCCPVCKEPMDVLLHKKLRKTLPQQQVIGPELCDKCKQKFTEENKVVIYEADTSAKLLGRFAVANMDSLVNLPEKTKEFIEKNRFILMLEEEFSTMMENFNEHNNKS